MNRKLHNSLMAFSASGTILMAALFAAGPAASDAAPSPSVVIDAASARDASIPVAAVQAVAAAAVASAVAAVDTDATSRSLEARIEAKSKAFEAEMDRKADGDVGETLASALAFAAEISTEAALVAAFQNETGSERDTVRADEERRRQRHARQIRGAMAVPYFSFAQGLRNGAGS